MLIAVGKILLRVKLLYKHSNKIKELFYSMIIKV